MSISEYNGSDEEILQVHSAAARTRPFSDSAALDALYKADQSLSTEQLALCQN